MADSNTTDANVSDFAQVQPMWDVTHVPNGIGGRGDWASQSLRALLAHGWEPFSVSDGCIWLRKKIND